MISLTPGHGSDSHPASILDLVSASLLVVWLVYSMYDFVTAFYKKHYTGHGGIKLPPDPTPTQASTRRAALCRTLLSHLATDLHEDGEAVDEDGFWRKVCGVFAPVNQFDVLMWTVTMVTGRRHDRRIVNRRPPSIPWDVSNTLDPLQSRSIHIFRRKYKCGLDFRHDSRASAHALNRPFRTDSTSWILHLSASHRSLLSDLRRHVHNFQYRPARPSSGCYRPRCLCNLHAHSWYHRTGTRAIS